MKFINAFTLDFFRQSGNHLSFGATFLFLVLIFIWFVACTGKMTVEEAKKVMISIDDEPLIIPPRQIDDILIVLNQNTRDKTSSGQKFRTEINKPIPQTDNPATLADYYHRKGDALIQLGRHSQALTELRLAYTYTLQKGSPNHRLLKSLAVAEFVSGNFRYAIELFERSLRLKDLPSTYNMLVKLYTRIGDLKSAENYANQGISLCNRLRNQKGWGRWPDISADYMKGMILEARGEFSEAELYYRKVLKHFTASMRKTHLIAFIVYKIYLARNLINQDQLINAEVEIRETLRILANLDKESELFGTAIGDLGEILLKQGRLQDAAKILITSVRIMQEANVPADSYLIAEGRMRLGEVLTAEEKYYDAMQQFDLARLGMRQNQYLYEKFFARNPALILALLRSNRIQEASQRILAAYAQNNKLMGTKHYLTAEALGFRGMMHALQKQEKQALQDLSDAIPILIEKSGGETFSFDRRMRLRNILESYLELLTTIQGSQLEKDAGIDAIAEGFKLADALNGSVLRIAITANTARAAVTSKELADLVRKEQDAQKQLKLLEGALSDNLAAPANQQLPEVIQTLKNKIDILERARQALVNEINISFPQYADLTSHRPVSILQVRKELQPDEAFIYIYTSDKQSYVWAIPWQGPTAFSLIPLSRLRLSQMVSDLRGALDPKPITIGDIPDFDIPLAYELYRQLLEPVKNSWQSARDLLIVAYGPLGQLPFALLPTSITHKGKEQVLFSQYREVPWLIRKASITRLPSAATFVNLRSIVSGDSTRKAFIGFGDPVFNPQQLAQIQKENWKSHVVSVKEAGQIHVRGIRLSDKGNLDSDEIVSCKINNLNRLPDTATEIKYIAKTLGADLNQDVFLRQQASEQQVKSMNLLDRKVIAFATHALVPGDIDGLNQPALALSAPSITGDNEDGLLTMGEILRLKINADWVVLSACNTGAAEGKGAEAISGLGRAFLYAGTRTILVSMWPVETTSARQLTTGLFKYQQEDQTLSRAKAMQKSTLALIDGPGLKDPITGKIVASYAHPLFWAPFIVVGESGSDIN